MRRNTQAEQRVMKSSGVVGALWSEQDFAGIILWPRRKKQSRVIRPQVVLCAAKATGNKQQAQHIDTAAEAAASSSYTHSFGIKNTNKGDSGSD